MPKMQTQTKFTDYEGFVDKFKAKKTTDDCYTPEPIYEALADWLRANVPQAAAATCWVRPFYPGGDFENEDYPDGCAVVDNPPFSILSKIVSTYLRNGVKFWLFAPHLTMFHYLKYPSVTAVVINASITYANGAQVNTGFLTNMWPTDAAAVVCGSLKKVLKEADKLRPHKTQKKIVWPANVTSSALLGKCVVETEDMEIPRGECAVVNGLDNGQSIFGGGLLVSDRVAAELRAAELRAAELRAAELRALTRDMLSEAEKMTIEILNRQAQTR